ncbi:MAG: hypothetical protein ACOCVG_03390, partial [Verrucomicrobiota bacterium]
ADTVVFNDRLILGDTFYGEDIRRKHPSERPLWGIAKMRIAKARYIFHRFENPIRRRAKRKEAELMELHGRIKDIVVKDPRFCLTLAEWRRYAGVDKILFSYRHPLEVARSLQKREHMPIWFGLRMWHFHVEKFLQAAQGIPLVCVDFNRFFDQSDHLAEMERCYGFAGRTWSPEEAEEVLGKVLKKKLKNNTSVRPLPQSCAQLYRELERWRSLTCTPLPYQPDKQTRPLLDHNLSS